MRTDAAMLREYKRRRPKKVAERKDPLAITQAPCCGRCRFWTPPTEPERDPFGECGRAGVTESRWGQIEKGTAISREELRRGNFMGATSPLRVRSWAPACSLFVARPQSMTESQSRLIEEDGKDFAA